MSAPITITACINQAATAIATDAAISSWVSSNYPDKTLAVWIGEDGHAPPTEQDCPVVVLTPPQYPYDIGTGADRRNPGFEIDWCIAERTVVTNGAVRTYTGQVNADALGMLIYACLLESFGGDALQVANYMLHSFSGFPLWEGGMTVQLTYYTGLDDEPTL